MRHYEQGGETAGSDDVLVKWVTKLTREGQQRERWHAWLLTRLTLEYGQRGSRNGCQQVYHKMNERAAFYHIRAAKEPKDRVDRVTWQAWRFDKHCPSSPKPAKRSGGTGARGPAAITIQSLRSRSSPLQRCINRLPTHKSVTIPALRYPHSLLWCPWIRAYWSVHNHAREAVTESVTALFFKPHWVKLAEDRKGARNSRLCNPRRKHVILQTVWNPLGSHRGSMVVVSR